LDPISERSVSGNESSIFDQDSPSDGDKRCEGAGKSENCRRDGMVDRTKSVQRKGGEIRGFSHFQ
jgi:hypothetical protein